MDLELSFDRVIDDVLLKDQDYELVEARTTDVGELVELLHQRFGCSKQELVYHDIDDITDIVDINREGQ